jgi:hypothetical protein
MEFDRVDVTVPKLQGNVGVARAVYEYTKRGYTVLAPLSDSDKYDLVVDIDGDLKKVQVKTSRHQTSTGGYEVTLATKGGNRKMNTIRKRSQGDYDELFVLIETGECWSIPTSALKAKHALMVTAPKYSLYKM